MIERVTYGDVYGTGNLQVLLNTAVQPKGVLVLGVQYQDGTDQVSGVEVSGIPATALSNSPVLKTTGENMVAYGYFLGTEIPFEQVSVDIAVTGSATKRFGAWVLNGADDIEVVSARGTASDSIANPEQVLNNLSSRTMLTFLGFMSGSNVPDAITARSGYTLEGGTALDHGTQCSGFASLDEVTTEQAVTVGYDCSAEDVAMMCVALAEAAACH